ncbi:MAG: phospholipase D-like domain-containing protein [Bryobacterales bacterium]|nr:phospholipase D-like domain-containing protein [Bryobacterales bacterium]
MRADLLREIYEKKDVTNAVVLTHNIDFVFLQTVVLSALRRCGQPALTVFADAGCAAASYAAQAPVIQGLGVRFRVVSIEMEPGFRFHPKAVLLSGPSEATLCVGSGNLTFGGWRENAEHWLRFEIGEDGPAPFAAFQEYLRLILRRVALSEQVQTDIEEAFDPATRTWAAGLGQPGQLLGRPSSGPSLLGQMFEQLDTAAVDRVTVCSPYFDDDGAALAAIIGHAASAEVSLLVQPGRTGLKEAAWSRNAGAAHLRSVTFQREDDQRTREVFIHAKFYAFKQGDHVTVFVGSANCSRAALLIPGEQGNAELLAVQRMDSDEFRDRFQAELHLLDVVPVLPIEAPEMTLPLVPPLRVLAASYENGCLRVAYAPPCWKITACEVDGLSTEFEHLGLGCIRARLGEAPREVTLEGKDGNARARTAPRWVDQEWQLRSTARCRSLGDAIRKNVRAEAWGFGAWAEVLEALCSHLTYLPRRASVDTHGGSEQTHVVKEYTADDVFAVDYSPPRFSAVARSFPYTVQDRVHLLQQLLLRWFEVAPQEPGGSEEGDGNESDAEEPVDRPEHLPGQNTASDAPIAPTKREARRAVRIVEQLCKAMTASSFLADRPPEWLGADLRLTSILFRVALRNGWLDEQTFFTSTHRIWSSLFYSSDEGSGWIQRRHESARSQADFAAAFRSPELVAALAGWALAVSPRGRSPEHARFALGSALAIAQLPWLWDGLDHQQLSLAFTELLTQAGSFTADELDAFNELWLRQIRRGHALRRLEEAVSGQSLVEISKRISQTRLRAGDLLWQGKAGFCVVIAAAERTSDMNVRVLRVYGNKNESWFKSSLTTPIAGLLDQTVLPPTARFGDGPRRTLAEFLNELSDGFSNGLE